MYSNEQKVLAVLKIGDEVRLLEETVTSIQKNLTTTNTLAVSEINMLRSDFSKECLQRNDAMTRQRSLMEDLQTRVRLTEDQLVGQTEALKGR